MTMRILPLCESTLAVFGHGLGHHAGLTKRLAHINHLINMFRQIVPRDVPPEDSAEPLSSDVDMIDMIDGKGYNPQRPDGWFGFTGMLGAKVVCSRTRNGEWRH